MGVLACDRAGCGNIMCDRYSSDFGYICDYCYEELKQSNLPINIFMKTPKKELPNYDYEKEFKLFKEPQ